MVLALCVLEELSGNDTVALASHAKNITTLATFQELPQPFSRRSMNAIPAVKHSCLKPSLTSTARTDVVPAGGRRVSSEMLRCHPLPIFATGY